MFLGKKYLETHEVIELHAMGNAAPGAVIASENLVRHNYAIFGDIRTQAITVQSNNYRGESKKPKLFIVLKRHPEFFENMKKLLTAHFDHLKVDPALANALPLPDLQRRRACQLQWPASSSATRTRRCGTRSRSTCTATAGCRALARPMAKAPR